jgi:uncharacterized protein YoxC
MSIDLNLISLEQALLDVEVANARVIDLTKRLHSVSLELKQVRKRVDELEPALQGLPQIREDLFKAQAEMHAMRIKFKTLQSTVS